MNVIDYRNAERLWKRNIQNSVTDGQREYAKQKAERARECEKLCNEGKTPPDQIERYFKAI